MMKMLIKGELKWSQFAKKKTIFEALLPTPPVEDPCSITSQASPDIPRSAYRLLTVPQNLPTLTATPLLAQSPQPTHTCSRRPLPHQHPETHLRSPYPELHFLGKPPVPSGLTPTPRSPVHTSSGIPLLHQRSSQSPDSPETTPGLKPQKNPN